MATGRNRRQILLRLASEGRESVRQDLRSVRSDVRDLGREEARIRIDVERRAAEAQIAKVERRLERLSQKKYDAQVGIQMATAVRQLDSLEGRLARLAARDIEVDIDVKRGALERTASTFGTLERRIGGLGGAFSNLARAVPVLGTMLGFALRGVLGLAQQIGSMIGDIAGKLIGSLPGMLGQLGGVLGPMIGSVASAGLQIAAMGAVAGGVVVALNALVGAVVALGAALVAMVASLTLAIGGLGALAVAFGAILAPAVFVVIGLFTRFAAILKARQEREQMLERAVQDQKTAEEQRTAAVKRAEDAEARLARTAVEGRRAMKQAAEDYRDSLLAIANAEQGVRNADLALDQANAELKQFLRESGATGAAIGSLFKEFTDVKVGPGALQGLFGGATGGKQIEDPLELRSKIEAVRNARLAYKGSIEAERDAEREAGDARAKHNEYLQKGIEAYEPYVDAQKGLVSANEELADAINKSSAAQDSYQRALSKLSSTERGSLSRINGLIDAFTRLAKAFTDPIFRALNGVFDTLSGKAGGFQAALTRVGTAFGDAIRKIGTFLGDPRTREVFGQMADGAAHLARELGGRGFTAFLTILREIASAAMPAVKAAATKIADALEGVARKPKKIKDAVLNVIEHFKTWAGLGWQLLRAVAAVFRAAAPGGKSLAGSLTTIVKKWADWANDKEGQNAIRAFFDRMIKRAKRLVNRVVSIVRWLRDNLPAAAEKAKAGFETLVPVLETIWGLVERISNTISGAKEFWDDPLGKKDANNSNIAEDAGAYVKLMNQALGKGKTETRIDAIEALSSFDLDDRTRKELAELLRVLKRRLRGGASGKGPNWHEGGTIPGVGDIAATLQGGEEVIKRGIARQLRPQLKMLNAGVSPEIAFAGAGGGVTNSQTFNINKVPAGLDERALASWLDWRARRKAY